MASVPGVRGRVTRPLAALASTLIILAAFAYLFLQTRTYFIDVPFWDEWVLLPFIAMRDQGGLTLAALASPHNEHIPLFPRVILIALAGLTHWNLWYECVANLVLGALTLVPMLLWIRQEPSTTLVQRSVLYASLGVIFFSLNQWENWMWGWQVEVFLCTAALTWGIYALTSTSDLAALLLGSLCGLVATFSFATGILFWPATLLLAWFKWGRRPLLFACWLAIGVAVMAWYLHLVGWLASESSDLRATPLFVIVQTALRVLGSALVGYREKVVDADFVGIIGLLAAIVAAIKAWHERGRSDAAAWRWWTLLAFALGSMVLIAVGRRLPAARPVPSRYFTFANVYWAALLVLLVRVERRLIALALVVPALTMMTAIDAKTIYADRKASLLSGRAALYAPIDNPLIGRFFWRNDFVLEQLPTLRRLHLSLYDCARQFSKADWDQAAATIQKYSRPGDVIVTSNDWGAACLGERLNAAGAGVQVQVISAGEAQAKALTALQGKPAAFTISGGDVVSAGARTWIERHGYPLYRSPIGSLRLFFYPDRLAFVRDRLRAEDVAADRTRFDQDRDLISADDDKFFLWGWDHPQRDRQGRYRSILTPGVSLYVPVVRKAPTAFRLDVSDGPLLGTNHSDLVVTALVNDVPVGHGTLARDHLTVRMDLSSAAWRYGTNIVQLQFDRDGHPVSGPADMPLLMVRRLLFE